MKKIPVNSKILLKQQFIYLALICDDAKPWQFQEADIALKDLIVPRILMVNREDGLLGFVGGAVFEGEMIDEALRRTANEEIGYILDSRFDIEPVVAHELDSYTTHIFMQKMPFTFLQEIHRQTIMGEEYGKSIIGSQLPHLYDYDGLFKKGGGLINLIANNCLAPSVREELVHVLLLHNICSIDILSDVCIRSGYKLTELMQ